MHPTINIITDDGKQVVAQHLLLSLQADVAIFGIYAQWFINRLKAGYCVCHNPFNQQPTYVAFKNTKAVVFWTKIRLAHPYLPELDERGIHYYFQFTLNDYETEQLETHIPSIEKRIETFQHLSESIGKEKVIWRFDPLIMTDKIGINELLQKWNI